MKLSQERSFFLRDGQEVSRKVPSKEFPRKNMEYHFFDNGRKSGRLLDFLSRNNPLWVVLGETGDALPLQRKMYPCVAVMNDVTLNGEVGKANRTAQQPMRCAKVSIRDVLLNHISFYACSYYMSKSVLLEMEC